MDIGFQPHSPVSAPECATGGAEHSWPPRLDGALSLLCRPFSIPSTQRGSVAPLSLPQVSLSTLNYKPQGLKTKNPPGFQEQSLFLMCFVLKKGGGGSETTCSPGSRAPAPSGAGSKQPVQARQCSRLNKESTSAQLKERTLKRELHMHRKHGQR